MKTGPLWCVTVTTNPEAEEAVSEFLQDCFSRPTASFVDADSGATTVSVYFSRRPAGWRAAVREGLARVQGGALNTGPGKISVRKIHGRDWANSWKRHFHPLEVGVSLLVKPSWSRRRARAGQAEVVLDPGLSFGTGQHPTTLFCLRQLVATRSTSTPQSVLDLGTGSGILCIAAVKLGYTPVHGFDFDPVAIRIARANTRRNGVLRRVQLQVADVRRLPLRCAVPYDVVCANLSADVLTSECARIAARVKSSGILVLAGILRKEFRQVARTYASAGFKLVASQTEKEWQGGAFVRSPARAAGRPG